MKWSHGYNVFEWHEWFAWHPVQIRQKHFWLEKVLRKADYYDPPFTSYIYRELKDEVD